MRAEFYCLPSFLSKGRGSEMGPVSSTDLYYDGLEEEE